MSASTPDETRYERELGGQLLASVSRSFYLTLKALPRELREPISLAYLLARTADTMADTAAVPVAVRRKCLAEYGHLIRQPNERVEAELVARVAAEFSRHQEDAAEVKLMERLGEGLAWLRSLTGAGRGAVEEVLAEIIAGQQLDIARFPGDGEVRSLQTAEELDDYTYRVAGCVGHFWTMLCQTELRDAFLKGTDLERQVEDGVRMGKGLQLVNILRDVGKDHRLGRCYLPKVEWVGMGVHTEVRLLEEPERLDPLWDRWAVVCEDHLGAGLDYVCRIQNAKVRYATALPLMLALSTLKRLRGSSWERRLKGVKVSRIDVARLLPETLIASRSTESLRGLALRLRSGS